MLKAHLWRHSNMASNCYLQLLRYFSIPKSAQLRHFCYENDTLEGLYTTSIQSICWWVVFKAAGMKVYWHASVFLHLHHRIFCESIAEFFHRAFSRVPFHNIHLLFQYCLHSSRNHMKISQKFSGSPSKRLTRTTSHQTTFTR